MCGIPWFRGVAHQVGWCANHVFVLTTHTLKYVCENMSDNDSGHDVLLRLVKCSSIDEMTVLVDLQAPGFGFGWNCSTSPYKTFHSAFFHGLMMSQIYFWMCLSDLLTSALVSWHFPTVTRWCQIYFWPFRDMSGPVGWDQIYFWIWLSYLLTSALVFWHFPTVTRWCQIYFWAFWDMSGPVGWDQIYW